MGTVFLGAQWVRADFHLHTRADREFKYTGDDNFYNSNYVNALEKAGIQLGVITNHNKFDFGGVQSAAQDSAEGYCAVAGVDIRSMTDRIPASCFP